MADSPWSWFTPPHTGGPGSPEWNQAVANQNAMAVMQKFLDEYGLGKIGDRLWKYIVENGVDNEEQLGLWLAQQPEYKARFPAMEALKQKGRAITPAQYVQLERAYGQIMHEAGMPASFYDKGTDFTKLIAAEVSPSELQSRVQDGYQKVANADPRVREQFAQYFGVEGDAALAAFFVDPDRALPKLEAAVQAAEVSGAAARMTFTLGLNEADMLAKMGVTYEKALSGFEKMNAARDLFEDSMSDTAVQVAAGPDSELNGFGPPAPLPEANSIMGMGTGTGSNGGGNIGLNGGITGSGQPGPPMGDGGDTDAATELGIAYTFGSDGEAQTSLARRLAQRRAAVGAEVQGEVIDRSGRGGLGSAE